MAASTADFVALAKSTTRDEFVRQHPHYFLVGETLLSPPVAPQRTGSFAIIEDTNPGQWESDYTEVPAPIENRSPTLYVFGVRKTQSDWPSMITVGRTRNNDIVLNDVAVSKFHAYFRVVDDHLELTDAGSLVGTWVGEIRLPQKSLGVPVGSGQAVRFAHHEFQVLDAADCWIRLRARANDGAGEDGSSESLS